MSLKVGCPWVIKCKGLVRGKSQFWFHEGDKVSIASFHCVRTCEPSFPRYFKLIDRAGLYTQIMTTNAKFQLCTMLDANPRTPTRDICIFLERVSPQNYNHWYWTQSWCIKVHILEMIKKVSPDSLKSFEVFQMQFFNDDFKHILDSCSDISTVTNAASAAYNNIWSFVMNDYSSYRSDNDLLRYLD